MKKILLTVILLLCSFSAVAQVTSNHALNNVGQPIISFYNPYPNPVSCYYKDQYNYITFIIYAYSYSMWYPVYGQYEWQCRY